MQHYKSEIGTGNFTHWINLNYQLLCELQDGDYEEPEIYEVQVADIEVHYT